MGERHFLEGPPRPPLDQSEQWTLVPSVNGKMRVITEGHMPGPDSIEVVRASERDHYRSAYEEMTEARDKWVEEFNLEHQEHLMTEQALVLAAEEAGHSRQPGHLDRACPICAALPDPKEQP